MNFVFTYQFSLIPKKNSTVLTWKEINILKSLSYFKGQVKKVVVKITFIGLQV